jgi:dTDP-glucose 4,6-dehydratase
MLNIDQYVKIVNLDKITYAANPDNLKGVDFSRYKFAQGDIGDETIVSNLIHFNNCTHVVNFAAETHVDRSIMGECSFERTNVSGILNLLKVCRDKRNFIKRLLLVSTDEVYGSIVEGSFKETDILRPRNPYAASKAARELFALSFYETYGLDVVITRGTNTYGPFQYPEKVIPLFVTNALEGKNLPLYGTGLNIRDWLYVDDHCRAIQLVLSQGDAGQVYNIAGHHEITNLCLTNQLLKLLGLDESRVDHIEDRKGHDLRYSIDDSKLRELGYQPRTSWNDGIKNTVNWYNNNQEWWKKVKSDPAYLEYYKRQYRKV